MPIDTMDGKRNGRFGEDGVGDRPFAPLAMIGGYSPQIVLSNPQVLKPGQPPSRRGSDATRVSIKRRDFGDRQVNMALINLAAQIA